MRWRSCCLICRSFARMRLRTVKRLTENRPNLFFPLICEKPKTCSIQHVLGYVFSALMLRHDEFTPKNYAILETEYT
jgi:hypothetical protein